VGKSTNYRKADKARIKVRRKAIKLVENEIQSIDKRVEKLFDQISATRQDYNSALFESDLSSKQRDLRVNLFQNNLLEFQAEVAELYARKDKLRTELVVRGDDLADLLSQLELVSDDYSLADEPIFGC
jgi:chromosome segregation ATPase